MTHTITPGTTDDSGALLTPDPDDAMTLIDGDDAASLERRTQRLRLRMVLALALLASVLVLTAIGTGTYFAVERSIHQMRASTLQAMLETLSKTLDVWIQDQIVSVQRLARDRQVRQQVGALVAIAVQAGVIPEQYCAEPMRRPLVAELDDALAGTGAVRFNIVDSAGHIIASRVPPFCGLSVRPDWFSRNFDSVFEGETRFVPSARDEDWFATLPSGGASALPLVWIAVPILDADGQIIAALSVGHYAHEQFAAILAATRGGKTLEAYAFDRYGKRLSASRFAAGQASGADSLAPQAQVGTAISTPLMDEALAAAAVDGGEGLLVEPYRGPYGRDVIGAWRWLAEYRMGIAIEISSGEAYAPLQTLRFAFAGVFVSLVLAVLAALTSWYRATRRRFGDQRRLGPYVLGERIGEGGHGNVYLARHDLLKRPTAVKLLKPSRATDEMVERFKREVQLASQLSHPNMVEIFDYGRAPGGVLYYAMEYLEGSTVGDIVLRCGALPVARAVYILNQVCAGLAEAHGKGLVHRDISATNIMVCHYGGQYDFVKILDFGLVKSVAREQSQTITRTLRLLGTPLYMAPERLRDPADVDFRSDIYAVGAVAFFLLAGRKMFASNDALVLTSCALNEIPPRLSKVAPQPIPSELDALVARCLEKRREDRPQHITELSAVFDGIAQSAPWTQRDAEAAWRDLATPNPDHASFGGSPGGRAQVQD